MSVQALPILNSCYDTILRRLRWTTSSLSHVHQAHGHVLKTGLSNETYVATKLLSLYANNLSFIGANALLHSIPYPDLSSFSTLIYAFSKHHLFSNALRTFSQMLSSGIMPDPHIIPSAIKACTSLSAIKIGKQVHGIAFVSGCASDEFVLSSLFHMYVKFNQIEHAHKLFDTLPKQDLFEWSALIAAYARNGHADEAIKLFDQMGRSGVEPNCVSWNGMIAGFNRSGLHSEAFLFFQKMHSQAFKPDGTSVSSVLPAIGDLKDLNKGKQVHGYVNKLGLESDNCVVSSLVDMYGKCASKVEMFQVFNEMSKVDLGAFNALIAGLSRNSLADNALNLFNRFKDSGMNLNVVTWTSIIACCSQNGKDLEALELFREMQAYGVKPNFVTLPCLLPACGNIAALKHGKSTHCFALRMGIYHDVYVCSALIDMYAKCGKIRAAQLIFDSILQKNLVCWNAIIGGYSLHGMAEKAIETFSLMQKNGHEPDSITLTCVLSACSQRGLTKEGLYYYNIMSKKHGFEAKIEHYACLVTLFGRAGKLEEACSVIKKMPFEPDACVWGALLSSCRVHNNVSLAETAAKKLFELEPNNPGNYVLLSNIYACKGMWSEVDMVRDMMKRKGLRKNPGCSWIEVKNKVHMLLAGDKSHPQMAQINEKLNELSMEMRKLGYFPNIEYVLQDVEEQDKVQILCGHSEKLAVVFGLLHTPAGTSLTVIKNLRICGDCHKVIQFISSFENREILVRDTNRFHHFKNGICSCGDYW